MSASSSRTQQVVPFWRNVRVLRVISQIVFLLLVALGLWWLYNNLQSNLRALGLNISFDFLNNTAGFPISEGIEYDPTDTNGYAYWVGVVNTLRVILVGIVFATIVGTIIGISRLSSNWLIRKLAGLYIETIRNIPLLVQLFFWYFAVMLTVLPLVKNSIALPGSIYLSRRGLYIPWPLPTEYFGTWGNFLIVGLLSAIGAYILRKLHLKRADRPGFPFGWAFVSFVGVAVVGWFLTPGRPLIWDLPVFGRFNFTGGIGLSASFVALLIGLVLYTGAYIAEIVRAGIQSVDRGQAEAAKAAGLTPMQILRLVILPQALRVIVPPLISQYLNLTKNSSLAILIGYYDLLNVGTTIFNQTGRAVEVIRMVIGSYLLMSLLTSLFMNYYNRRIRLVEH
jgi:general L-amino acid transport system permease protein